MATEVRKTVDVMKPRCSSVDLHAFVSHSHIVRAYFASAVGLMQSYRAGQVVVIRCRQYLVQFQALMLFLLQ